MTLQEKIAALPPIPMSLAPIARLLTWCGPEHYDVPFGGIAARTYREFSKADAKRPGSYWANNVELVEKTTYDALLARNALLCEVLRTEISWDMPSISVEDIRAVLAACEVKPWPPSASC